MSFGIPPYNPYDPSLPNYEAGTPPPDEIHRMAIEAALLALRVLIPAQITQVLGNQKVHVQPLLQKRYVDGTLVTPPVIQNVPVQMPMGADWSIKVPIAVGDTGSLIFCDRSLDVWLAGSGGIVDPQDTRAHDISDPIFVPGLVPFSKQTQDSTTDLVVTNGKGKLKVQKAGTFTFGNGSQEIMNLLDQVIGNLDSLYTTLATNTFTNTLMGPQPFIASTVTALQQLQTSLESIKSNFDTLKGS